MIGFSSRRRPVWEPSRFTRVRNSLSGVLKAVTFKRTVLAVLVLPVSLYIYREVTRNIFVIDPFTVPKEFEETGLKSEVIADRISDALQEIETTADTGMQKDEFALRGQGPALDVEIPGTKLGLKTLIDITRAVFGIYPKHVGGDIVVRATTEPDSAKPLAVVTIHITEGKERTTAKRIVGPAHEIEVLAQRTSEMILNEVNPFVLGQYRYEQDDFEGAAAIAERLIHDPSQDRNRLSAHLLLGMAFAGQKKYDLAAATFRRVIELGPNVPSAYYDLGKVFAAQKKYDEAITEYRKAIELDPKHEFSYNEWGVALANKKEYNEAAAKFRKVIELDPKYSIAFSNLGQALADMKQYEQAIAAFHKAIELDLKNEAAYNNFGLALANQNKYSDAIVEYGKAIKLNPKYSEAYNNLGTALAKQNRSDEAIAAYQKAIKLDPNNSALHYNLGLALANQKRFRDAIAEYRKAIALDPNDASAYDSLGFVLKRLGHGAEAREKFAKARELSSQR